MKILVCVSILAASMAFAGDGGCMSDQYSMSPVGRISKSSGKTVVEIAAPYRDALLGMEGFSHIIVLYWFDQNDNPKKRATLRVHPRADERNPITGVFATRSPARPNLIGFTVCKVNAVEKDRIVIDDIDAFDGTPVIDIKPYIPASDCVPSATVPWWVGREK